jgi:hypothetical protein
MNALQNAFLIAEARSLIIISLAAIIYLNAGMISKEPS